MRKLRIYDTQFAHGTALGCGDLKVHPKEFSWTRKDDADIADIAVVSESCFHLLDRVKERHKVGLIIEPPAISPGPYRMAADKSFQDKFDVILTHNQSLIDSNPDKFAFYPFMGCWIEPDHWAVYANEKDRNASIVASDKTVTEGHRLRHAAISAHRGMMDVFGRGYNPIPYKLEALQRYRFHVVIENDRSGHWFTEKLIDCFATGTIPIYWGTDSIGDFYNTGGMIRFSSVKELGDILGSLNEEEYMKRLDCAFDNFDRASAHGSMPDNYIFDKLKERYKF